jgi:hypothetical protein
MKYALAAFTTAAWPSPSKRSESELKLKHILAATAITAWSGMACADYVTTFGQNKSPDALYPLTFYPEAVIARDNFVGLGTASFFDFEAPEVNVGAATLNISLGGVGTTLSGDGKVKSNPDGGTNNGRYSVSGVSDDPDSPQGTKYWEVTAPTSGTSSFTMSFDRAVESFGFFATDVGDYEGLLTLELTLMDDTTRKIKPGGDGVVIGGEPIKGSGAAGSVLFFGVSTSVASEYFKSVRFISAGGTDNDFFGFDMFTVSAAPGTPVPLPGSLALVGAALGGLALVRRRRS